MKTPIICQRYGISERTLSRWTRQASAVALPPGSRADAAVDGAADGANTGLSLCHDALRVVIEMLRPAERQRAVRLIEDRLDLTHGRLARVLLRGTAAR